ncbi:hypothetical protein QR685DRAFT_575438 [Neurospora intermedia]|uniref:Uncharacterized protein n=1 Tax=Neurospora intermedia TaxID=5142 RepID=A0ABR3D0U5_NEUIN
MVFCPWRLVPKVEAVANPVDQQSAQNPINQLPVQNQIDEQPAQNFMAQPFVQHPAETIVHMDRVMTDVVGTDRHEAYWSILDDIYYFIRDHRWASIPDVRGNFRSRPSIEASYRPVGPPPAYVQPIWPVYEASTLAVGKEDIRQLVQDNIQFALDAFRWAAFMDRFGALEVTYANLGQTRPIIASLHGKLALHEQQGVSWDTSKHGVVDHVMEAMVFKNEPEFLAGEEWEKRQKSHQIRTKNGFSQASFADAPRLPEQEKAEVLNLVIDAFNERDIVDKAKHSRRNGEQDNHVLVEKRHMSLFNMESTGWKALRALRFVALGMPNAGVFNLDFVFKPYDTFRARLQDFQTLFASSKAAVTSTTESSKLTRFAGRPSAELSTKRVNKNGADRKAAELTFASEVRRNMAAAGQHQQGSAQEAGEPAQAENSELELPEPELEADEEEDETLYEDDAQDDALAAADGAAIDPTSNPTARNAKRRRMSDDEGDALSF